MSDHRDCYWGSGKNSAHCDRCHRSFSSTATFDAHQPGNGKKCIDITTLRHNEKSKYAGRPIYQEVLRTAEGREFLLVTRIAYEFMELETA